jgi:hypothetical protein
MPSYYELDEATRCGELLCLVRRCLSLRPRLRRAIRLSPAPCVFPVGHVSDRPGCGRQEPHTTPPADSRPLHILRGPFLVDKAKRPKYAPATCGPAKTASVQLASPRDRRACAELPRPINRSAWGAPRPSVARTGNRYLQQCAVCGRLDANSTRLRRNQHHVTRLEIASVMVTSQPAAPGKDDPDRHPRAGEVAGGCRRETKLIDQKPFANDEAGGASQRVAAPRTRLDDLLLGNVTTDVGEGLIHVQFARPTIEADPAPVENPIRNI